jgi:N4-gp56 family major capsid protein
MALTTAAQLPPAVREYYDRLLMMTAYPMLVHTRFAQRRVLPKKKGDRVVFRRYNKMDTVPVPLTDGITPPGASLSATDIIVQAEFYGNFVTITDQVTYTVEDNVLNEASRLLAQNLGQTLDEVTRDVLNGMASTLNCSNGVNNNTPTELTKADIDSAVVTLLSQDALMISEVIEASDKFSTSAVRPAFFAYIDTSLLDDLENVSDFLSASNYSSIQRVIEGEWGSTGNVRWLYTSVGAVSSASPAVYSNFIMGKEAYACIHLGGEQGEFNIHPLGSAGAADPLNQRGSVSWKHPFAARILNDNFSINLLATHS